MRVVSLKSAIVAAALAAAFGNSAVAAGPFAEFGGSWKGTGLISDVHGKSESLSCKSSNSPATDGIAMTLSLVCASDSYRVDFHSDLFTDGQELRGTWKETTRNAEGNVHGQIGRNIINATTEAPGFTANITIRVVSGKQLKVGLNAQGTSINRVDVSMTR